MAASAFQHMQPIRRKKAHVVGCLLFWTMHINIITNIYLISKQVQIYPFAMDYGLTIKCIVFSYIKF